MQGFIRNPKTGWRKIGRDTIVLDFQNKRLVGLNPTAGWMWAQMDSAKTPDWFAKTLRRTHSSINMATIRAFLNDLKEANLLQIQTTEAWEPFRKDAETADLEDEPKIIWEEPLQQVAGTCALVAGMSVLCNQAPFS